MGLYEEVQKARAEFERDVERIAKAREKYPCPPQCPSKAGYMAHIRNKTKPCAASKRIWRDYYRDYRRNKNDD